jgi:hypothetical protein
MYSCTQRAAAAVVVCHGGTETTQPYCGLVDVILDTASEYTFDLVSVLFSRSFFWVVRRMRTLR